jgi:hypothetical protein
LIYPVRLANFPQPQQPAVVIINLELILLSSLLVIWRDLKGEGIFALPHCGTALEPCKCDYAFASFSKYPSLEINA